MVKFNWKYISFLAALLVLYFVLLYFMPQKFNWFVTLYEKDKDPFGAYIFRALVDNSWFTQVNTSNQTLFELQELEAPNLLVLCEDFATSPSEIEAVLKLANEGKSVLIAAHQMDTVFADSLNLKLNSLSFHFYLDKLWGEDSLGLKFRQHPFDTSKIYWLPEQMLPQYFETFDVAIKVIAENTKGNPVLLYVPYGRGNILLSSTPLTFTNFSMVRGENHEFVAGMLSYLQPGTLHWTEYYQLGRMEATTPLRYVLSEPALKWALYIFMISLLFFMGFEMKRKQRIIPVVTPLKNETIDFVKTVSRLYYLKKDHKNLASKKILHFTDYLRRQIHIDVREDIQDVIKKVASKTNSKEHEVKMLFDQINFIGNSSYISPKELKLLLERINRIKRD